MRILVLLMFLASGHAFGHIEISDEFVELASPACKEIASTYNERAVLMQRCGEAEAKWRGCIGVKGNVRCRAIKISPNFCEILFPALTDLEPVTMTDYLICERKETQRQLQEIQDQLQGIQEAGESVSSASEKEKIEKFLRDRRPPVVRKQVGFRSP